MVEGMVRNGYERDFAERCFRQIEGFGEYGFPGKPRGSFALLVYVSCWLKCHYPDVFCAPSSTPSRWASTRRRNCATRASATPASTASRSGPVDINAGIEIFGEAEVRLPPMPPGEQVVHDYRYLSLSLKAHPVSFLRQQLDGWRHAPRTAGCRIASGRHVDVAGLVLVRQRPGSAKGVIFMTLEDETGVANVIVWPKTFERYRPLVLGSRLVRVSGRLQNEMGVIHVVADGSRT
jgi:DNA polymerase III alpha subunit